MSLANVRLAMPPVHHSFARSEDQCKLGGMARTIESLVGDCLLHIASQIDQQALQG